MFLDVSQALCCPGERYPFEAIQPMLAQDILGETVTFDDVRLEGTFEAIGQSILAQGELKTVAHMRCANCLAPVNVPMALSFKETFAPDAAPDDPDRFFYESSKLEFSQMVVSLVVLALPMRVLCKAGCQGLCSQCGKPKDLCTCQKEVKHPFEALQQLLTKDEEV